MKIIAVTACAVGLAHTYMAAASLKKPLKIWVWRFKWKPRVPWASATKLNPML